MDSDALTSVGVAVAAVAVIGSTVLGWEWGDDRLVPTAIGVVVALVAAGAILLYGDRARGLLGR